LYSSPKIIIRVMKPRGTKWVGHICHMSGMKKLKGRDHLENLGVDGKIIL